MDVDSLLSGLATRPSVKGQEKASLPSSLAASSLFYRITEIPQKAHFNLAAF